MTTTTTNPLAPLTPADMPYQHYSVHLSWIGEDGDIVALGHVAPLRALAAFNRLHRVDAGNTLVDRPWHHTLDDLLPQVRWTWATRWNNCEDCRAGDPPHRTPCPECADVAEADWWIEYTDDPDQPGAFPVTVWTA